MTVLVSQKRDPGRLYTLINVKEICVNKLFDTDGKCIKQYYKLVDMSGELHDECWDVDKYDIYTKFELNENNNEVNKILDEI